MPHRLRLAVVAGWMLLTAACSADVGPATTPAIATASPATSTPESAVSATPHAIGTIVVAVAPTLPPIIVTNPLPGATPPPSPTEDLIYLATATVVAAIPRTPLTATAPPTPCALSLPGSIGEQTAAAVQHFEHGLMFWLQTRNEIWVLIDSPTAGQFYWHIYPNEWIEGQPESDPTINPPRGRYQPVRGFGVTWRTRSGVRDDLGWAIAEERGFNTTLTYYPQGFYSPDCVWVPKSGIYELSDAQGKVYRFTGEGGVASIVTNSE